jgi:hypothetical protein
MAGFWAGVACLLLTAGLARAADRPDPERIDRKVPKEPAYNSKQPLYGLLVFGPQARAHVWMVLDRSTCRVRRGYRQRSSIETHKTRITG